MFERYYALYMENAVALASLEKMIAAGKLTRKEVDGMVADRMEKYGF